MDRERIALHMDLRHLTADELRLFQNQALGLADALREHPDTADLLTLIAMVADTWSGDRLIGVAGSVEPHPTTPLAHTTDAIGQAIAWAMPIVEDDTLSPAIRGAWNDVIRNLSREIRDRYGR